MRRISLQLTLLLSLSSATLAAPSQEAVNFLEERMGEIKGTISPSHVDSQYPPPKCGTAVALASFAIRQEGRFAKLEEIAQRPPNTPLSFGSTHFVVHYNTGSDAPYQVGVDVDPPDGVPDYVNRVAEIFEHVWEVEIDSIGFVAPPQDNRNGGDSRYDVYLLNLGFGYFGFTDPESTRNGYQATSFIELENDFAESVRYRDHPLDGARVTAAHEFFHAIQFGYDATEYDIGTPGQPATYRPWWMEASATMMEDVVYTSINDYIGYLPFFYRYLWMSLTTFSYGGDARAYHPYASCVWPIFMSEKYRDVGIVREIWEACASVPGYNTLPATNSVLSNRGSNLDAAFLEFEVWNFHVGPLADSTRFFREGSLFPAAETTAYVPNLNTIPYYPLGVDPVQPEDMAANTIVIHSNPVIGGVAVDFDGVNLSQLGWHVAIVGYKQGGSLWTDIGVSPQDGLGSGAWRNWDSYDAVVIIPAVSGETARDTINHSYTGTVRYDSTLYVNRDIATTAILSPIGAGRKGDPIIPVVRYANVGRDSASFDAHLIIRRGNPIYDQTVNVSALPALQSIDVAFPEFIPVEVGLYEIIAFAELSGDENALNDTLPVQIFNSIGGLGQVLSAYPSPFVIEVEGDVLTIPYSINPAFNPRSSEMSIFDASGVLVRQVKGLRFQGSSPAFGFKWDGKNDNDEYVASGIYIYMLDVGSAVLTGKIAVINKIR